MIKILSGIIVVLSILLIGVSFSAKKKNVHIITCAVNVHNNEDDYCVEANLIANELGNRMRNLYNVTEERLLYENATPRTLRTSLEQVPYNCDFLVLYLGSHGGNDNGFFQAYLTDGNHQPRGTEFKHATIRGREIIDRVARLNIPTLIIIDTCHSGGLMRDLANLPENISVIAACSEKDCSYSFVVTPVILDALRGGADFNRDRNVTIRELQRYCYINAPAFRDGAGLGQEIIHFGESDRVLVRVH